MAAEKSPPQPWDATWEIAFDRFDKLATDQPRLIAALKDMPEVRGLFIKSSMFTAFITPYSCYPDFFDGRRITIDVDRNSTVIVRYLRDGFDKSPAEYTFAVEEAATQIAALCREHL